MMLRSKGILTQLMPTNCSAAKQLPQFCIIIKSQKKQLGYLRLIRCKVFQLFFYLSIIAVPFSAASPYNSLVFQAQSPAYPLLRQQSFQTSASPLEAYLIASGFPL